MKRKICLLLCLALTLGLLSGCKLIVKDEAVDAATPAVEVNGEVITKGEVNERALRRQAAQQYLGIDVDPIETARSKVIDKLIREKAIEPDEPLRPLARLFFHLLRPVDLHSP